MSVRIHHVMDANAERREVLPYPAGITETSRPAFGMILIVDDEPAIVEMLASLFEDEGYLVTRAFDGEQALLAVVRETPALDISDISLPRMNGVEPARRLRMRPGGAIPAIPMSAAVRDSPGERGGLRSQAVRSGVGAPTRPANPRPRLTRERGHPRPRSRSVAGEALRRTR